MVPYLEFRDTSAPVAYALSRIGITWGSALVSVGAICGITSVILVLLYGQTRIFFAMARDGLLPCTFGTVHPRSAHAGEGDPPRGLLPPRCLPPFSPSRPSRSS